MQQLIFDSDEMLNNYLANKERSSPSSARAYRSAITRFLEFVGKNDLTTIKRSDSERYFAHLDSAEFQFKLTYKLTQLKYIRSFFEYVAENCSDFKNPIPNPKMFKFTPDPSRTIHETQEFESEQTFEIDEIIAVLKKAKIADYEHFMQLILLTFCGMRVSECVSIKKANIDLDERYVISGLENDCRKSNKDGKKPLIFIFPSEIADILFDYLCYHEKKYGKDEKWLFPARHSNSVSGFEPTRGLQRFIHDLNCGFTIKSHKFRKTIESFHAFKGKNIAPDHIIELLSNHAITSVVFKHYAKCSIEERRSFYDQYFPNEYRKILAAL